MEAYERMRSNLLSKEGLRDRVKRAHQKPRLESAHVVTRIDSRLELGFVLVCAFFYLFKHVFPKRWIHLKYDVHRVLQQVRMQAPLGFE